MRDLRNFALPMAALLAGLVLTPAAALADTIITGLNHSDQPVTVNVGFNAEVPIADPDETRLAATQKVWRERVYRLGREECTRLLAVVAETCRLTSINVSTDIRQYPYNPTLPLLYINGNDEFAITVKYEADAE